LEGGASRESRRTGSSDRSFGARASRFPAFRPKRQQRDQRHPIGLGGRGVSGLRVRRWRSGWGGERRGRRRVCPTGLAGGRGGKLREGVGGSYAIEVFEDDVVADFQNSFGVNGRAGYRCHPRFSAEVEVEWLDGFETVISDSKFGKIFAFDAEPLVVTVNTKGYLLTGRYQPFVLLGMGAMMADLGVRNLVAGLSGSVSETGFAMRLGGGIDFYATKHVVVSVEADYVLPFDDLEGLDYISIGLGLQYRF